MHDVLVSRWREDTSRYQERQNQVRREAGRAKELRRLMTAENKVKKKQSRNIIPADQKVSVVTNNRYFIFVHFVSFVIFYVFCFL